MAVPSVHTSLSGDCLLARISGDMIYENQALLRGRFDDLLQHPARCIVLDLTQVTFCDSAGLNVLLDLRLQAEQENTVLFLACVPATLRRVLEITGIDQVLRVYDTVTDAQDAWTRQASEQGGNHHPVPSQQAGNDAIRPACPVSEQTGHSRHVRRVR